MNGLYIMGGYAEIQRKNNISIYDAPIFADIQINRYFLHTTLELEENKSEHKSHYTIFSIRQNKIEKWCETQGKLEKIEYAYVHFQQRKLNIGIGLNRFDYLIVPPNRVINRNDTQCDLGDLKKIVKDNIVVWNIKGQLKRKLSIVYKKLRNLNIL